MYIKFLCDILLLFIYVLGYLESVVIELVCFVGVGSRTQSSYGI